MHRIESPNQPPQSKFNWSYRCNRLLFSSAVFSFAIAISADAYCQDGIPTEITTPDHIQSKLGDLDFKDGYPSKETAEKIT